LIVPPEVIIINIQYAGMQKYDNSVYMIHIGIVFLPYNHLHLRVILWFTYRWWLFLFRLNVGYMIIELLVYIVKYTIKAQNALKSGFNSLIHFGKSFSSSLVCHYV